MDKQIKAMIDELQKIRSQKKDLEKRDKELTETLKVAMQNECGNASCEYIHGKIKAVVTEVSKNIVDTDRLKREFPEVHVQVLKASNYTTLTIKAK